MGLSQPFRCERCGYVLAAVPSAERCPECGVPVEESRPERRAGLAWQRGASLRSWIRTLAGFARRPVRSYREVRVHTRSLATLTFANIAATVVLSLACLGVALLFGDRPIRMRLGPTVSHTVYDGVTVVILVLNGLIFVFAVPMTWAYARWFARHRKPPMVGGVSWISAALTSTSMLLITAITSALWLVRYLVTPTEAFDATDTSAFLWSLAMMLPLLTQLVLLIACAILDAVANRWNRLANSLDSPA